MYFFLPDYLLSNNHVNAIIVHKFDFSDEEVMAYYISFLKTLSFRLNKHTIHFFYNEVGRPRRARIAFSPGENEILHCSRCQLQYVLDILVVLVE